MFDKLKNWNNFCSKTATKMTNWIKNGGWIIICVLGAFGVILALTGMVMHLFNFWYEDKGLFFAMLFIGLILWVVAAFEIYAIINVIRRNKDLFKY